ncbi:Glucose-methanol-choline oxidoreductase [Trypanosoma melophagium]|uniref:Glucose-methanol-choline oxidoreductase n=1 Tax=Trypanosoma melophagium TaxID=715481 RepID=UPI00351A9BB9|nr:Glucose-methanol-choline oxidoreductase [Trypanosoma melophagium]
MSAKGIFDVLVLGAGAAGCAAARSIALKYPNATVCLVEKGTRRPPPLAMRVPLLTPIIPSLRSTREFIRTYHGVPEGNIGGRHLTYVRGRGLGGSSWCNDMKYLRGTATDYEAWGDPAWSFEQLLPFFNKLERNSRGASDFHGDNGPLAVSDAPRSNINSELNIRWFEACEALGIPETVDFNNGVADGFSAFQSHIARGVRVDVFDALLEVDRHLFPNLTIMSGVTAHRLLFNGQQVRGVEILNNQGREVQNLSASRVVICLGSLDSPALLQRSGVGSGGKVAELPGVGQNLIQSCSATIVFGIKQSPNLHSKSLSWGNVGYLLREWKEYGEERSGIFASLAEGGAFVRSTPTLKWPDLSLTFFPTPNLRWCGWIPFDGFAVRVTHHYPQSRGEVVDITASKEEKEKKEGKNKKDDTLRITSGMLSTQHDVQCMDEGVRWVGSLCTAAMSMHHHDLHGIPTSPFSSLGVHVRHPPRGLQTRLDTAAFLGEYAESGGDLFGTCAIGEVVDNALRVRGVDGVHVADASIVPTPTCGASSVIGAAIGSRVALFLQS